MLLWLLTGIAAFVGAQDCGIRKVKPHELTVVGGTVATPYSWPWQVAMYLTKDGVPEFICGGSLISEQWVATAAHCFQYNSDETQYTFALGIFNQTNQKETGAEIRTIKTLIKHPSFDLTTFQNDIALVELSTAVNYTEHIYPICLSKNLRKIVKTGLPVVATGWGRITATGPKSDVLRQVEVEIIDTETCAKNMKSKGFKVVPKVHLCAGILAGGKDTCEVSHKGDSGGPLQYKDSTIERWVLVGITSTGFECAKPSYPGVYTRMVSFNRWVRNYTKVSSY